MPNCSEKYVYTPWHTRAFDILAISIPTITFLNTIASVLTVLFIGLIKQLRIKYIFSLKLFVFNTAECVYTLYQTFSTSRKYSSMHSKSHIQILAVLQLGQIIAIGFITYGLIQKASGSLAFNNKIIRPFEKGRSPIKLLALICASILANITLSVLIHKMLPLYGAFAIIDILLYINLYIKVSKMRKRVRTAVSDLRKKALTYVTMLFVGFMAEISLTIFLGASHKEQLVTNCQPTLSITDLFLYHALELRFLWDVVAYFAFNAYPRKLLYQVFIKLQSSIMCRVTSTYNSAAVVPLDGSP